MWATKWSTGSHTNQVRCCRRWTVPCAPPPPQRALVVTIPESPTESHKHVTHNSSLTPLPGVGMSALGSVPGTPGRLGTCVVPSQRNIMPPHQCLTARDSEAPEAGASSMSSLAAPLPVRGLAIPLAPQCRRTFLLPGFDQGPSNPAVTCTAVGLCNIPCHGARGQGRYGALQGADPALLSCMGARGLRPWARPSGLGPTTPAVRYRGATWAKPCFTGWAPHPKAARMATHSRRSVPEASGWAPPCPRDVSGPWGGAVRPAAPQPQCTWGGAR